MLGHIESYDRDVQTGVIKYEDKYYEFYIDAWKSQQPPEADDDVEFVEQDGLITEVSLVGEYLKNLQPVKSRIVAGLLGLFTFGLVGAPRFYLGYYKIGIIQIVLNLVAVPFGLIGYTLLWGFAEGVLILAGHIYKDAKGRPLK